MPGSFPDISQNSPPPPASDEFPPEEFVIGRGSAWMLVLAFLLLLGLPPLVQNVREIRKGPDGWVPARELVRALDGNATPDKTIAGRLRDFDAGLARQEFTEAPREWTQQFVTAVLRRGNDRSVVGRDGWAFFRPGLQALTGYGPVTPEPHSVSRDPSLLDWEPPLEPIAEFAAGLKSRGVELWLVPVPMKPSIYPEKLTGKPTGAPVRHADTDRFFSALEGRGVRVIDLASPLWNLKSSDSTKGPVYMPGDTHWTPRAMACCAEYLASLIRQESWFPALTPATWTNHPQPQTVLSEPGFGDLIDKLDLRFPNKLFPARREVLQRILDPITNQPPASDLKSSIVLIGDSFVNIFDDPSLGFAAPGLATGQRSGAGLAQHLAAQLHRPLDVHAVNGDGASGVRQWLARRGETAVKSKKLVIWVIAERDLFLSRSVAKANRVAWKRVPIAPDPAPDEEDNAPSLAPDDGKLAAPHNADGALIIDATVLEKSVQPLPDEVVYPNSLYSVKYKIRRVISGTAPQSPAVVVHWNFQVGKTQPTARIQPGKTYRLTLEPWSAKSDLQTLNLTELDDYPEWFAASAEPVDE